MNENQGEFDHGGPWNNVQYRNNRKTKGDGVEWTFLIQNLSDKVNRNILWRAFQPYGYVSDAYVARKRDARGRCFGFVRYVGVERMKETLASMNTVKMFGMKAMVSLAKYDKDHNKFNYSLDSFGRNEWRPKGYNNTNCNSTGGTKTYGQPPMKPHPLGPSYAGPAFVQDGKSYADLVRGSTQGNIQGAKVVTVDGKGSLYPLHCIGRSVIGYMKEIQPIINIRRALSVEGLDDVGLSYIGGRTFMITCKDKAAAKECLEKHFVLLQKIFSKFFIWNGEDIPPVRLVNLCIFGVPFLIRDGILFDKIGSHFGEVVRKSSFSWQNEDNSMGSVMIATSLMTKIDEVVVIKWNEKTVTTRVVESCVKCSFYSDKDSMADSSDSELESVPEDEEDPVDMEEVEEGEIRENPVGDVQKQDNDDNPTTVGGSEPQTGDDAAPPVENGTLSGAESSLEGQKSGDIQDSVEKCNVHGDGVPVDYIPNAHGENRGESEKSTNQANVVDKGTNNSIWSDP
ncbi:putative RNA recognition motif domain, nucleotide-binding alpha-beta plait domain superfamily [Helianthus debilis subsp. tardiflorus]